MLSSALAFDIVKYLGAAYLIYIGIRKLLTPVQVEEVEVTRERNLRRIYSQGVVVALLNPKTALFFLAFLPQFVDVSRGQVGLQTLELGLMFVSLATVTDSCYALLTGTAGNWLRDSPWYLRFQRYVAGIVYIGAGLSGGIFRQQQKIVFSLRGFSIEEPIIEAKL